VAAAEVKFWEAPDFSHVSMPPGFPDALRATAKRFMKSTAAICGRSRSATRWRRGWSSIAPAATPRAQRGPPGVRRRRLTFAGDAVFAVGFDHPEWFNGFEHDPEEAARVRIRLLRELAETGGLLVATHLPFPSVGHVAIDGDAFRWVPVFWDY
jgi:hypothetical protein